MPREPSLRAAGRAGALAAACALVGNAAVAEAPKPSPARSPQAADTTKNQDATDAAHRADVEEWRRGRLERLTSDEGWLTVSGLFWLKPGRNTFGAAKDRDIVLPPRSAPPRVGAFVVAGKRVTVEVDASAGAAAPTIAGKPVTRQDLRSDGGGEQTPDVLALARLRLFVIERGGRLAIRLRDLDSPRRKAFKGLDHFPIRSEYRVVARFVPHAKPTVIAFPTVVGTVDEMQSPGTAVFTLGGRELRLDAALETKNDTQLFFIFRDPTAGKETYGAGRFFYSDLPKPRGGPGGPAQVVLDFNKAYTPPCAFTPFAVCPLPPPQNRLPIRIEAGEKFQGGH